ncbi:MAG: thioredoxin family protein [Planctomycetota bacterium]
MRNRCAIGALLDKFVLCRVDDLRGIDVGHYDFDSDVTIFLFVVNAEEDIYLRYGGRDDRSPERFLNFEALDVALGRGLKRHAQCRAGKWRAPKRKSALFPRDFADIKRKEIAAGRCVHCHMLGSNRTRQAQERGSLDKLKDLWVLPDIRKLGIDVDPKHGLKIAAVGGIAEKAGILVGEEILAYDGKTVLTHADLQYGLDKLPRQSKSLELTIGKVGVPKHRRVRLNLPPRWRVTKIGRRSQTHALTPFPEFWARELSDGEREEEGIAAGGMGGRVTKFWANPRLHAAFRKGLKKGNIVYSVNGTTRSPYTTNPTTWIRLNCETGDTVTIKAKRGKIELSFRFKLRARPW